MEKITSASQNNIRSGRPSLGMTAAFLGFLVCLSTGAPAVGGDGVACIKAAGVLEKIAEELPNFQKSDRKARFALMKISSASGVALAHSTDEGWSPQETAPLIALREMREPDESGKLLSREKAPGMIFEAAESLAGVLEKICPETQAVELESILFAE